MSNIQSCVSTCNCADCEVRKIKLKWYIVVVVVFMLVCCELSYQLNHTDHIKWMLYSIIELTIYDKIPIANSTLISSLWYYTLLLLWELAIFIVTQLKINNVNYFVNSIEMNFTDYWTSMTIASYWNWCE